MENILANGLTPLSRGDLNLPSTSFDELLPFGPTYLFTLLSKFLRLNLSKITLSENLTGKNIIPSYALQDFHSLPFGYYSNSFPSGYGVGFNVLMLGEMNRVRKNLAAEFAGCEKVLDLGCGEG